jgi:hypothetical protein
LRETVFLLFCVTVIAVAAYFWHKEGSRPEREKKAKAQRILQRKLAQPMPMQTRKAPPPPKHHISMDPPALVKKELAQQKNPLGNQQERQDQPVAVSQNLSTLMQMTKAQMASLPQKKTQEKKGTTDRQEESS